MKSLTLHIPHLDALLKGVEAQLRDFPQSAQPGDFDFSLPAMRQIRTRGDLLPLARPFEGLINPEQISYQAVQSLVEANDEALWFAFDWAHWIANRDDMVLMADLSVTADEQALILSLLNAHFAHQGLTFLVDAAGRGFIRVANAPEASFYAASRVKGQAVTPYMPNAAYWRAILNEIQMLFYPHDFNVAREMRNQPTINSLWIWTPDATPLTSEAAFTHLAGDEPALALVAQQLEAEHLGELTDFQQLLAQDLASHAQVYVEEGAIARQLSEFSLALAHELLNGYEQAWMAPALKAVKQGRLEQLIVSWGERHRLIYQQSHGWRLWRRHPGWSV